MNRKKGLSLFLVLVMLLSFFPTTAFADYGVVEDSSELKHSISQVTTGAAITGGAELFSEKINANSNRIDEMILELKDYYLQEDKKEYNYLEAMTLKSLGVASSTIQDKIKIDDLSEEYAKAIMGIIGAGFDPRAYNGKDYIKLLADSQTEEGYFGTGNSAEDIAYSILALDMAGGEYDVFKAVEQLESKFTIQDDKAFVKKWSFSSEGELDLTSISLIALSNYKELINKDLIEKAVNYIESERLSSGMYGTSSWTGEKVSGKLTSKVVQVLLALDIEIEAETINGLLSLQEDNIFREEGNSGDATKEVFAALTDVHTGDSMFKGSGDPARVEIVLPRDTNEIKSGKEIQLLGKAYDENQAYNPSNTYLWSSDDPDIATVDKNTGKVKGINNGSATIRVKVEGFEGIEDSLVINVADVEPHSIEILVDEDLAQIEVARKTGINALVKDLDEEIIEQANIQWEINPQELGELDSSGIFTALESGNITIKASVEKGNGDILSNSANLRIVDKETKINEALEEVKDGIVEESSSYGNTTAMGLKLMGIDQEDIASKAQKYSRYSSNANTRAKDIMVATVIGRDPRDYDGRDYVKELIDEDFYNEENAKWLANSIIALDMVGEEYDQVKAINSLKEKLTKDGDKYYVKYSNRNIDYKTTALILVAFSNHREISGVVESINGIKNCFKAEQIENALIGNCENHSLAVQALLASGEDIYSDQWTKLDKYGNRINLLDALLSLKVGSKFKLNPDDRWINNGKEIFAFAALSDLSRDTSMYHEFNQSRPKEFTIEIQEEFKNRTIKQGEEIQLQVKVFEDGNLVDKEIIWESSDEDILEVEDGLVKGLREGAARVKGTVKSRKDIYDETTITVKSVIGEPAKLAIKGLDKLPVKKGDNFQLQANIFDANGNNLESDLLKWESKNPEILSVTETGHATAHDAGLVEIIAKISGTEIEDRINISVFADGDEANNTIDSFVDRIQVFYETIHFVENQSSLNAWETATFTKAGFSLDKWDASKSYEVSYDKDLNYLGNKANQALIMLDLGESPANYKGRNLIKEIVEQINKSDYGHAQQNYLRAVRAVDRFNESYKDRKVDYDENIIISNILKAQTKEGGFKERGDDPVALNTGYALKALSAHRSFNGVEESINKAIAYLQSVQKEDGGFYMNKYQTGNNAEIISGLLSLGEDLTSSKWTKGNMNPIESMFILWNNRGSFDDAEDDSINNRPWITATQKSLHTLIDLKEAGYSNYVVKSRVISELPDIEEETLKVHTAIAVGAGGAYELKSDPQEVEISSKDHSGGLTALGALQATASLYEMTGSTVTSIYGIENKGSGGWMYAVNDKTPSVGADKFELKEDDKVVWFYSPQGMDAQTPTWEELTGEELEEKISVKIRSSQTSIKVGDILELIAQVNKGEQLTEQELTWSSSKSDVATIDEDGKLTAHKSGETTITVSLVEDENIQDSIKISVAHEDAEELTIEKAIQELRAHYSEQGEFTFRAALGYNYTSDNLEKDLIEINSKFTVNENPTSASEHVGNIMGLIAAGKDPYNYSNKNYVEPLVLAQNKNDGKFVIGEYDDYSTTQAFSVLALDMANANYNTDAAVDALLEYQDPEGSFGGADETGMLLSALGKYKEIPKVKTAINKGINYLKTKQDEMTGGFEAGDSVNPFSASAVIQGLIAIGEDPFAEVWTKGGKTMVDSLLSFYKDGSFDDPSATEQGFIALADIYRGESMFSELSFNVNAINRIKIQKPSVSRIMEGDSMKLDVTGYDSGGKIVPATNLRWTSSNGHVATVDSNGNLLAKKPGKTTVSVELGDTGIKDSTEIEVLGKEFEVKYIGDKLAEKGKQTDAKVQIKNLTSSEKPSTLIIGLYDEQTHILKNYSIIKRTLESKEQIG